MASGNAAPPEGEAAKKPAAVGLSSRLMQMKFMQRATERQKWQEAEDRAAAKKQDNASKPQDVQDEDMAEDSAAPAPSSANAAASSTQHLFSAPAGTTPPATSTCVVTYTRAPLPPALAGGRMSFGPAPPPVSDQEQQGAMEINDEDMAQHTVNLKHGKQPRQKQQQQQQAAAAVASSKGGSGGLAGAGAAAAHQPPAKQKPDRGGKELGQQAGARSGGKGNGKNPASVNPYATLREAKRSKKG